MDRRWWPHTMHERHRPVTTHMPIMMNCSLRDDQAPQCFQRGPFSNTLWNGNPHSTQPMNDEEYHTSDIDSVVDGHGLTGSACDKPSAREVLLRGTKPWLLTRSQKHNVTRRHLQHRFDGVREADVDRVDKLVLWQDVNPA